MKLRIWSYAPGNVIRERALTERLGPPSTTPRVATTAMSISTSMPARRPNVNRVAIRGASFWSAETNSLMRAPRRAPGARRGALMRLFVSALQKLAPRMATLFTFGLLAGMLVLIDIAVVATRGVVEGGPSRSVNALSLITFPGAYDQILSFILGLGGLFAVTYGAAIAGSEWTWGTLKTAVVRGESRSRYLVTTFAAIGVVMAVGILFAAVVGVIAAAIGATVAGIGDRAALEALPAHFLRGWVAITETAAIGFAVATLARSQLAGIGVGIALYFGETFAGLFLPDVVKYLPFHLATAVVGGSTGFAPVPSSAVAAMSTDTALILVAVWLLGSLVVAAGFGERAEITG